MWREFAARISRQLFHQTGVLWLSNDEDAYLKSVGRVLGQAGVEHEELKADEIARRWPQLRFHDVTCGVLLRSFRKKPVYSRRGRSAYRGRAGR